MKIIAFLMGFLCIAVISTSVIGDGAPDPIYLELYLIGFLAAAICSPCFAISAIRRSIPAALFVSTCIGAVSGSTFYIVLTTKYSFVLALASALVLAAGIPRLFRPGPNNSFKPTPLRGAA